MNAIGVGVAAAAGVLAVLVSAGIMKALGKSATDRGATVLYILLFAGASTLGREFVEPRIQALRAESFMLERPIFRAMQQDEPEAYARILAAFENGFARKQSPEQMGAIVRPVMQEVFARRLPHASDEVLVEFANHVVSNMLSLHAKGGTACFSYVNPVIGDIFEINAHLGPGASDREMRLMENVVVSTAGKSRAPLTEEEAAIDLERVMSILGTRFSKDDMALAENPHEPGIDKRRLCEVIIALFKESAALPTPRNARLIRYLAQ